MRPFAKRTRLCAVAVGLLAVTVGRTTKGSDAGQSAAGPEKKDASSVKVANDHDYEPIGHQVMGLIHQDAE